MDALAIRVKTKEVYGTLLFYPVCEKAKLFGEIAGTKTLTESTLRKIINLGYRIEHVKEKITI
jgi:hypothetical protein